MRSDFCKERAGEMVFPSCAEEQSRNILGEKAGNPKRTDWGEQLWSGEGVGTHVLTSETPKGKGTKRK